MGVSAVGDNWKKEELGIEKRKGENSRTGVVAFCSAVFGEMKEVGRVSGRVAGVWVPEVIQAEAETTHPPRAVNGSCQLCQAVR